MNFLSVLRVQEGLVERIDWWGCHRAMSRYHVHLVSFAMCAEGICIHFGSSAMYAGGSQACALRPCLNIACIRSGILASIGKSSAQEEEIRPSVAVPPFITFVSPSQ